MLAERGFKSLVLAAKEHQARSKYVDIHVTCVPGEDDLNPRKLERCKQAWLDTGRAVADRVLAGEKVLVTCMAGQNRSGFITTVALHHLTGWSGEKCVRHVQQRRDYALCNTLFEKWLIDNLPARVETQDVKQDVTKVVVKET